MGTAGSAPVLFAYGGALIDEAGQWIGQSPALNDVITAIQWATGAVADGQSSPKEAAERYRDDLIQAVGEEIVVTR